MAINALIAGAGQPIPGAGAARGLRRKQDLDQRDFSNALAERGMANRELQTQQNAMAQESEAETAFKRQSADYLMTLPEKDRAAAWEIIKEATVKGGFDTPELMAVPWNPEVQHKVFMHGTQTNNAPEFGKTPRVGLNAEGKPTYFVTDSRGRTKWLGVAPGMKPTEEIPYKEEAAEAATRGRETAKAEALEEQKEISKAETGEKLAETLAQFTPEGLSSIYGNIQGRIGPQLQGQQDVAALKDLILSTLTVEARSKLRGQGQITEGEQKMLARAISVLDNPKISDKLATEAMTNIANVFGIDWGGDGWEIVE